MGRIEHDRQQYGTHAVGWIISIQAQPSQQACTAAMGLCVWRPPKSCSADASGQHGHRWHCFASHGFPESELLPAEFRGRWAVSSFPVCLILFSGFSLIEPSLSLAGGQNPFQNVQPPALLVPGGFPAAAQNGLAPRPARMTSLQDFDADSLFERPHVMAHNSHPDRLAPVHALLAPVHARQAGEDPRRFENYAPPSRKRSRSRDGHYERAGRRRSWSRERGPRRHGRSHGQGERRARSRARDYGGSRRGRSSDWSRSSSRGHGHRSRTSRAGANQSGYDSEEGILADPWDNQEARREESVARVEARRRGRPSESLARIEARRRERSSASPPRRRERSSASPPRRRERSSASPARLEARACHEEEAPAPGSPREASPPSPRPQAQGGNHYFRHGAEVFPAGSMRREQHEDARRGQWTTAPQMESYQEYLQRRGAMQALGRTKLRAQLRLTAASPSTERAEDEGGEDSSTGSGGGEEGGVGAAGGEDGNRGKQDGANTKHCDCVVLTNRILSSTLVQPEREKYEIAGLALRLRARNTQFAKPLLIEKIGYIIIETEGERRIAIIVGVDRRDPRPQSVWQETFGLLPFVKAIEFSPLGKPHTIEKYVFGRFRVPCKKQISNAVMVRPVTHRAEKRNGLTPRLAAARDLGRRRADAPGPVPLAAALQRPAAQALEAHGLCQLQDGPDRRAAAGLRERAAGAARHPAPRPAVRALDARRKALPDGLAHASCCARQWQEGPVHAACARQRQEGLYHAGGKARQEGQRRLSLAGTRPPRAGRDDARNDAAAAEGARRMRDHARRRRVIEGQARQEARHRV